jgi:hypothetical protein
VIAAGPNRACKFVGAALGTGRIVGDIVSPVIDFGEMEVYRR